MKLSKTEIAVLRVLMTSEAFHSSYEIASSTKISRRMVRTVMPGIRQILEQYGITLNSKSNNGTGTSQSETEELVMKLLRDGTKVDAIITSSDRAAFGALKALGKVGYYAPEDVRLISFDNSPYSMMASPSITAIDRNPKELARKACEILLAEINGEEVTYENIIEVSLVERDSTR